MLARELLPETPAAQWDAGWAHSLCKDALKSLARHYDQLSAAEKETLDLSIQEVWDGRMRAAGLENDPAAFRRALKGWEHASPGAFDQVRIRGGAA